MYQAQHIGTQLLSCPGGSDGGISLAQNRLYNLLAGLGVYLMEVDHKAFSEAFHTGTEMLSQPENTPFGVACRAISQS